MLPVVSEGIAPRIKAAWTSIVQQKIGIRLIVMPGQRSLRIVTTRLTELAREAMPRMLMPSAQKSSLRPGE